MIMCNYVSYTSFEILFIIKHRTYLKSGNEWSIRIGQYQNGKALVVSLEIYLWYRYSLTIPF